MHIITKSEQRLLEALVKDSRAGPTAIAKSIGRGRNWVSKTVRRLALRGVIRAYTTVLNPSQVYAERNTILLIQTNPRETDVSSSLLNIPNLESLDGISGDHSLLGLLRFREPHAFEVFLDKVDKIIARSSARAYKLVQVLTTYKSSGFEMGPPESADYPLSSSEWDLLRVITRRAPSESQPYPLSQVEIGKKLHHRISQPAVSKMIRRLKKRRIIVGHTIDLDFKHIDMPVKFFLQIQVSPGLIAETAKELSRMLQIWDLHRTSEPFSLFATVRTPTIAAYNQFLRQLYENPNVLDTRSQISLEEWFIPP